MRARCVDRRVESEERVQRWLCVTEWVDREKGESGTELEGEIKRWVKFTK